MLRTNLSTRPFYNERIVHAVAAVVAVLVLAVTAWQIVRVVRLSRYKTELNSAIKRDREQVDLLTREAADIRRGLDQKQLTLVATQAREANTLIEMRTFSWTQLFNQLESTLPNDVMLTSVRPEFRKCWPSCRRISPKWSCCRTSRVCHTAKLRSGSSCRSAP